MAHHTVSAGLQRVARSARLQKELMENSGPDLIGGRGMGSEIGAGLSGTRTGPDSYRKPDFNNLIQIKIVPSAMGAAFAFVVQIHHGSLPILPEPTADALRFNPAPVVIRVEAGALDIRFR